MLLLLLLLPSSAVIAQQDTVFWFAAPEVSASEGDSPIYLRLLSFNNPATVTVTQPANGGFTPIVVNLPANSVDSVNLTPFLASVESPAADVVSNNGLKIVSTTDITAYYELNAGGNQEIFSLKGPKGIGTNFYAPFQTFWDNAGTTPATFSSIDLVATEDNTTVLITPRTDVVGHVANVTYSITLQEGETYSARDMNTSGATSLAGSIISSNRPVAVTVFSGALSESGCTSSMGDQITTESFTGTDFIIRKASAANERAYVLATQNGTTITVTNSTTTTTLTNWSETYEIALTDSITYIETNKPVYVWHSSGYGCNLSGAQVPNLFCAGTYSSVFTRSSNDSLGLMLYTRTGFEGDFALNGNPGLIPASAFDDVPGTNGAFKVALIYYSLVDVPLNSYHEVTNTGDVFGMGVLHGTGGNGSSYAYLSEFTSYPFIDAGLDDTICANLPFAINGVVGGGDVTGSWSGTGFGSFQNGLNSLTNNYIPSALDTLISPINLILTTTGPCPVLKDTLVLHVTPAPIVNASADQTVCANNADVSLSGSVSGGASGGVWSTLGSGIFLPNDSTLDATYQPSAADTMAGSVTLVLTSTGNGACLLATDTMHVFITGGPTVDAGADTISVCANNADVSLVGSVVGNTTTGKWTTTGSGIFTPDNLSLVAVYQPSPNDINAGNITIYLESTNNGSCSIETDSVQIIFTAAPNVQAGANIIACANDPGIDLSGLISGPTTTGQWSGGAGTFSPDDQDLNASYTPTAAEVSNGSLFLTLTSTNNATCVAESDNVQISFVAAPFANFSFTEVCFGEPTVLTDFSLPGWGNLTDWQWDFDDNNNSILQDNNHVYGQPGSYDVSLIVTTSAGCSDTTTETVNVYDLPTAHFNYSASCDVQQITVDFTDSSYSSNNPINYWFYDFGGQGSIAAENPSQVFVGSGNFIITQIVGTQFGCVDTTVQVINIPERPDAGFYYNTSNGLNIGAEFSFYDTSYFGSSYAWEFGDGNGSTFQDPSHTYFANGIYIVTQYVYGALGCVDSTSIAISINTVTTEINTLIPNAISPNGDGRNDVWKLEFVELYYPDAQVVIFNRWGQQLFESIGYSSPWNGTFEGQPVPDGTYYYVINLNDPLETEPYKGSILVLRQAE